MSGAKGVGYNQHLAPGQIQEGYGSRNPNPQNPRDPPVNPEAAPPPYPGPPPEPGFKTQHNTGYPPPSGYPAPPAGYTQPTTAPHISQPDPEAADSLDDEQFSAFTDKNIRRGFIRKVFAILAIQLVVTGGIMSLFVYQETLRDFARRSSWMYLASIGVVFVMIIVLGCCGDIRRKFPANMICLGIFTLAMSWMLGTVASRFEANEVVLAVGIVTVITIGCFILGLQSKIDFTWMVGGLMAMTLCLIMFGIFAAIFRSRIAYIGYASLGAFIFAMWLIVDIQMMMGGSHKYAIDPEEYIFAALNLYVDIINLLLKILILVKLLGGNN